MGTYGKILTPPPFFSLPGGGFSLSLSTYKLLPPFPLGRGKRNYINSKIRQKFTLPFRQAFFKELQLRFSAAYTDQDFAETVRDYVAGKYAGIEGMVTDRIGLDEVVEKGFEALVKNRGDHVKILVTPKRGNLTSSTSGSG